MVTTMDFAVQCRCALSSVVDRRVPASHRAMCYGGMAARLGPIPLLAQTAKFQMSIILLLSAVHRLAASEATLAHFDAAMWDF